MAKEEVSKIIDQMPSFKDIEFKLEEHHKRQGYVFIGGYWLFGQLTAQWTLKARVRIARELTDKLLAAYDEIETLKYQLENVESQVKNG